MRRLPAPIILSLALLALFAGCDSHPPLTGLTVELSKLERAADGSVIATVQVVNTTVVAFDIARSKHQLFLNGRLAGTIEFSEPHGMPAQLTLPQSAPLKLAAGALTPGPATYRLDSALTLAIYAEKSEVYKTSETGTVQVP